ncbi:MAG TPA: hypothetical protein VJY66_04720, partial [Acholeplasma sp.]|nr:hypothetical protein [Acholeplasma sp.]
AFRFYFIVTEYIFTMAGLAILGVFLGGKFFDNPMMPAILGVVGMFIGLVITTTFVVSMVKKEND